MCEQVGEDRVCVSKLCVNKLAGGGGRRRRRKEAAGYRTKNKNPTQRCGELLRGKTTPNLLECCPKSGENPGMINWG